MYLVCGFHILVNPPDIVAVHSYSPIDVTPTTFKEIRMAIREIKSWKTVGYDSIPDEALNSDIEAAANILHVLFRKIWEE